jgi:hypothetical protein
MGGGHDLFLNLLPHGSRPGRVEALERWAPNQIERRARVLPDSSAEPGDVGVDGSGDQSKALCCHFSHSAAEMFAHEVGHPLQISLVEHPADPLFFSTLTALSGERCSWHCESSSAGSGSSI